MRELLVSFLNLAPGFGLGYLARGRRAAFRWALGATLLAVAGVAVAAAVSGYGHGARWGTPPPGCSWLCLSLAEYLALGAVTGGVLAFLAVSLPATVHLAAATVAAMPRERRPAGAVAAVAVFAALLAPAALWYAAARW